MTYKDRHTSQIITYLFHKICFSCFHFSKINYAILKMFSNLCSSDSNDLKNFFKGVIIFKVYEI